MLALPHRSFRLGALANLASYSRRHSIDLLHSHGKGAGLYARLTRVLTSIPCVHTFHGIHRGSMTTAPWWLYCQLERLLGRLTRAGITVSPGEQEQILSLGFCPASRLRLIPNGVAGREPSADPGQPPEQRRAIVHVTRFDPVQKNSEAVIAVALALRPKGLLERFEFLVLGDGPQRPVLEAEVGRHGLSSHFRFTGAVEDIRPFLKEAFCCLSTSRWEGLPLALLEAMSEGVPVIATDVVGNRDAVMHGLTGFLFSLDAPAAAADWIDRLHKDAVLWRSLADAAMQTAGARYSIDVMARSTALLYAEALCNYP